MNWQLIGSLALKLALWCYKNPAKVDQGLKEVHDAIDFLHKVRTSGK